MKVHIVIIGKLDGRFPSVPSSNRDSHIPIYGGTFAQMGEYILD
jgi:hypothetical protein